MEAGRQVRSCLSLLGMIKREAHLPISFCQVEVKVILPRWIIHLGME